MPSWSLQSEVQLRRSSCSCHSSRWGDCCNIIMGWGMHHNCGQSKGTAHQQRGMACGPSPAPPATMQPLGTWRIAYWVPRITIHRWRRCCSCTWRVSSALESSWWAPQGRASPRCGRPWRQRTGSWEGAITINTPSPCLVFSLAWFTQSVLVHHMGAMPDAPFSHMHCPTYRHVHPPPVLQGPGRAQGQSQGHATPAASGQPGPGHSGMDGWCADSCGAQGRCQEALIDAPAMSSHLLTAVGVGATPA